MHFGVAICLVVLTAFLWLVRTGLLWSLDVYGFWPYMAICLGLTALIVAAAFTYDYFEARSRR
jgi:hypothetical protein